MISLFVDWSLVIIDDVVWCVDNDDIDEVADEAMLASLRRSLVDGMAVGGINKV